MAKMRESRSAHAALTELFLTESRVRARNHASPRNQLRKLLGECVCLLRLRSPCSLLKHGG